MNRGPSLSQPEPPSTEEPPSSEVAAFLATRPPFDSLPAEEVRRIAAAVEVERFPTGATIFSEGTQPVQHLRVVRSGAVEIVHDGRVLDLLGMGELFGHASMLSGLPAGFSARAAEDTVCYRIGADPARALLAGAAGLRFVTRSLLQAPLDVATISGEPARDPANQPVRTLIRGQPVVCRPDASIREGVQLMAAAGTSSLVVRLSDGTLGILTDRDLRTRVLAAGVDGSAPVATVMSAPAYTCPPDRLGGEVLLDMLDRGLRHFPVVSAAGEILGVIEDLDLIAVQTRSSFFLRRRIAVAKHVEELAAIAQELRPAVIAMHEARVAPTNITAVYSVVIDALTRRLLDLAVAELGEPPTPFAWLALGSLARREAAPSSDVDSAIVYFGDDTGDVAPPYLNALAAKTIAGLELCGFHPDANGASASNPIFVRSLESWQRAARSWIEDPTQEKALILASVLVDSRPVWGVHTGTPVSDTFRLAPRNPQLLRLLARFALSHRPPTGFFRGLVVEHGGEHRGRLDLKHGGLLPIVDLARWAAMAAGVTSAGTIERLRAAGAAGTLPSADTHSLEDAFELITDLRLGHQAGQLHQGVPPDDFVDPATLSPLMRSHLKEAFRAVAAIQKRIASELSVGVR
jgi:CBS domain-containing protein